LSANVLAKQLVMGKGEIKVGEAKLSLPHIITVNVFKSTHSILSINVVTFNFDR
jgi:hypothetical protein